MREELLINVTPREVRAALLENGVLQEIFIEVWKSAGRYDASRASEATFIATIARRRIIDKNRAKGREMPREVLEAYHLDSLSFGPEYIIPKPLDPRLREHVATAVKQAAIDSGVARI